VIASTFALTLFTSVVSADTFNKKTKLTFSQPVRVPGATLSSGSYIFKLVDSQSNRNIVQVMNTRENKVYATVLAIPDYRLNPNSQTVVTFGEVGSGCAAAVKAWFYPGDTTGNRFVYGKKEAEQMAKSCQQPVPHVPTEVATAAVRAPEVKQSNSTEPAVVALVQAPIKTATPEAKEENYAQSTFAKADASDRSGISGEVPSAAPASKLPKSGSDIPAFGAAGMLLLSAGWLLSRRHIRD
jgi:LPXTG-motif cell wall-anchored protein